MALNLEQIVRDRLADMLPDIPVSFSVPADRPERFIVVERTGGSEEHYRSLPLLSVKVYDSTRFKASDTAMRLVFPALCLLADHPAIARVDVESVYNNPEPEAPYAPRYQINIQLIAATQ